MLDPKTLPGGDKLSGARVKGDLLIGIVTASWTHQAAPEQQAGLKSLLDYARSNSFETVMLLDQDGSPVGSASAQQLNLGNDLAAPAQ